MEKAFEALGHKNDNSGIVYMSRVPPFMKVEKVKFLLGRFGDINRIFLEPFDNIVVKKRKTTYKQGWVEFVNSEDAKDCALSLNNNSVGGKGFHCDDIWNIKYLNKFKWHHLQTQLARTRAIKQAKLRMLKAKVNKEHDFYSEQIKSSQKMKAINDRLEEKGMSIDKVKRQFKQRKIVEDQVKDTEDQSREEDNTENIKDLLGNLFQ